MKNKYSLMKFNLMTVLSNIITEFICLSNLIFAYQMLKCFFFNIMKTDSLKITRMFNNSKFIKIYRIESIKLNLVPC